MPFSKVLTHCERQTVSSRIWTRVAVSIMIPYKPFVIFYLRIVFVDKNRNIQWKQFLPFLFEYHLLLLMLRRIFCRVPINRSWRSTLVCSSHRSISSRESMPPPAKRFGHLLTNHQAERTDSYFLSRTIFLVLMVVSRQP